MISGLENLCHLPEVTQLVNARAQIHFRLCCPPLLWLLEQRGGFTGSVSNTGHCCRAEGQAEVTGGAVRLQLHHRVIQEPFLRVASTLPGPPSTPAVQPGRKGQHIL